jgi:hypothetical protein
MDNKQNDNCIEDGAVQLNEDVLDPAPTRVSMEGEPTRCTSDSPVNLSQREDEGPLGIETMLEQGGETCNGQVPRNTSQTKRGQTADGVEAGMMVWCATYPILHVPR